MRSPRRMMARVLPWLVAVAMLLFVLTRTDGAALRAALARAEWRAYALAAVAFSALWLWLDAFVLARLVTRFHRPISPSRMLPLRGVTYLLLPFSYDAAQAALALTLHRRLAIPLGALAGTFLFYYLADLLAITGLASFGSVAVPTAIGRVLLPTVGVAFTGVLLVATIGMAWARGGPRRVPGWLEKTRLLATLGRCRPMDLLQFAGWRIVFYATFVAFAAATLPSFGIHVPAPALVAFVPIIMSVSALPITVAGIGSTQMMMWTLYGTYGDVSAVIAYSLVYNATLVLLRFPIGVLFLTAAWRADEEETRGGVMFSRKESSS